MEFEFIKRIRERFPRFIGDDCTVLETPEGRKLLLSTDEMVENIHFNRQYFSLSDVGYKAVSAACSDIAAMGGKIEGILISLSLPKGFSIEELEELYDGIQTFCAAPGIDIFGGNITASDSGVHIVTCAIGFCRKAIRRDGAQPGDNIYVTGTLGGSNAGLLILSKRAKPKLHPTACSLLSIRHRRPRSRIEAGEMLGEFDVSAMIDISDGLFADLSHVADESNVGFSIKLDRIPLFPGVKDFCAFIDTDEYIFAARSGEEFELLFTAPPKIGGRIVRAFAKELDVTTQVIGKITRKKRIITLKERKISSKQLEGWQHSI